MLSGGYPQVGLDRLDHIEANSRRDNFVFNHQRSLEETIPWDKSCLYRMGLKTLSQIGCPPEDQSLDHIIKCQFCLIWDRYSRAIRNRTLATNNIILAPVGNAGLPDIYLIRSFPLGSINTVTIKVGKLVLTTLTPLEMETRLFNMIQTNCPFRLFGRFICGDQANIILQRPNYQLTKCYLDIAEILETADLLTILGLWIQLIRWVQYLEHLGMFGQYNLNNFAAIEQAYFDHDLREDSLDQINNVSVSSNNPTTPTCRYIIFPKDLSGISLLEPGPGCACNSIDKANQFFIPTNLLPLISSSPSGSHWMDNGSINWSDPLYLQSCLLLGDKSIRGYLNAVILLSQTTPLINPALSLQLQSKLSSLPVIYADRNYQLTLQDYQGVKPVTFHRLLKDLTTLLDT